MQTGPLRRSIHRIQFGDLPGAWCVQRSGAGGMMRAMSKVQLKPCRKGLARTDLPFPASAVPLPPALDNL